MGMGPWLTSQRDASAAILKLPPSSFCRLQSKKISKALYLRMVEERRRLSLGRLRRCCSSFVRLIHLRRLHRLHLRLILNNPHAQHRASSLMLLQALLLRDTKNCPRRRRPRERRHLRRPPAAPLAATADSAAAGAAATCAGAHDGGRLTGRLQPDDARCNPCGAESK